MNLIKKIRLSFGWLIIMFLFCFAIYGGWQKSKLLWPGVHEDGSCYSTVVINQAAGLGNCFSVYTVFVQEKGDALPFNGHGQLYYPIFSKFLPSPDYQSLLSMLHQSNLVGFLLAFFVFLSLSRKIMGIGVLGGSALGLGAGYVTLALLEYLQGRPDHGIPFVLLVFLLIQLLIGKNELPNWIYGIQIGIVAAISPLPGAILGVANVFVYALGRPLSAQLLKSTISKILFAGFTWLGMTALVYSGDLLQLAIKIAMASDSVNQVCPAFRIQNVLKFWAMPDWALGIGILYGLVFVLTVILAFRALATKGAFLAKAMLIVCSLILLNRIWFHGITFSHINYTFLCFFPSVLAWFLSQYETITKWLPFPGTMAKRMCLAVLAVALFLPSLGVLRNTLLLPSMSSAGVPYSQTFNRVKELKATLGSGEYIFIPNEALGRSAVIYDGPPWKMKHLSSLGSMPHLKEKLGITGKYFFWPQFTTITPPEIPGFRIIENTFNTTPVKILGIQISNHTPGHGYALYEKIP